MPYTIRKTRFSDIDDLAAVERSAGQAFKSIADLAWIAEGDVLSAQDHSYCVDAGLSWVAVETIPQTLTGFIIAQVISDEFYIAELCVSQTHQQKGIGSKLIQRTLNEARALGLEAATLTTFIDVPWNAPYYERLGFGILAGENLPSYLKQKLKNEETAGLPLELRCAMRKIL